MSSVLCCFRRPTVQLTQQALLYDIADTLRMQNGSLGCPLPQDLQGRSPGMYGERRGGRAAPAMRLPAPRAAHTPAARSAAMLRLRCVGAIAPQHDASTLPPCIPALPRPSLRLRRHPRGAGSPLLPLLLWAQRRPVGLQDA